MQNQTPMTEIPQQNINQPAAPQSTLGPSASDLQQPLQTDASKKKSKLPLILLILFIVLISLGLIAVGAYLLKKDTKEKESSDDTTVTTTTTTTTQVATTTTTTTQADPYEGWKTYTYSCQNDFYCPSMKNIIFKYSPNWEVIDKSSDYSVLLQIRKSENIGLDINYGVMGAIDCIYPDNTETKIDSPNPYEHDSFVELSNDRYVYRRSLENNYYHICQKVNGNKFCDLTIFGWIEYKLPDDRINDTELLNILDNILLSLEEN